MKRALILSSYVAASKVGGGLAPLLLPQYDIDPILVPTTLFGRHPGWGMPGGGPVSADTLESVIHAIGNQGLLSRLDVILTGYFATADQVLIAANTIDRARAEARQSCPVIVDPIIGDEGTGAYVSDAVEEAIIRQLVPRADLLLPNAFELGRLTGVPIRAPDDVLAASENLCQDHQACLTTSVQQDDKIGALFSNRDKAILAITDRIEGPLPKGSGDLFALYVAAGLARNDPAERYLGRAVSSVSAVLERAAQTESRELPLVEMMDLIRAGKEATEIRTLR